MDYSQRFDQIENVLASLLQTTDRMAQTMERGFQKQAEQLEKHSEQLETLQFLQKAQNNVLERHEKLIEQQTAILTRIADRLDSIERQILSVKDMDERIRKLEAAVFQKGA
jgi:transcription termination factor NusB